MPFQKGQSGNPAGRVRDKPWREALDIALKEKTAEGKLKLRAIAEKTIDLALEGDVQAIQEIANRMDGRPVQSIEATTDVTHYVIAIPTRQQSSKEWASQLDQTIQ